MTIWKQLRAIILLPGTVTILIPASILYFTGILPWNIILAAIGTMFVFVGLSLMIWTNRLFTTVGMGTLAPWNPPERLVVRGVYRHVRNPMLTGVFCILLGEAIFFSSVWLLGWFAAFCLVNLIYIPLREEPGLAKRFGDDYLLYKNNVPRWIPRLRPWDRLSGPAKLEQEGGHHE
jgi:protein-S-isoprenylcysteine O-methyltransferase Ste14